MEEDVVLLAVDKRGVMAVEPIPVGCVTMSGVAAAAAALATLTCARVTRRKVDAMAIPS